MGDKSGLLPCNLCENLADYSMESEIGIANLCKSCVRKIFFNKSDEEFEAWLSQQTIKVSYSIAKRTPGIIQWCLPNNIEDTQ